MSSSSDPPDKGGGGSPMSGVIAKALQTMWNKEVEEDSYMDIQTDNPDSAMNERDRRIIFYVFKRIEALLPSVKITILQFEIWVAEAIHDTTSAMAVNSAEYVEYL
ncbi:hypothetical protein WA026_018419 [Henosepilachna vigintioctopunctata]|uniref:Uncharacterized protein n=1 Tax=Henosepilachna vigintioctopunctata TaxID=420089 RepID=A0AAW1V091_9CUCU